MRPESRREYGFRSHSRAGVTVTEVLVTIGVIAVLAGLIIPAPGEYEYRCFMMYHYATEEKPEFYLLGKGKLVVAPAAPSK